MNDETAKDESPAEPVQAQSADEPTTSRDQEEYDAKQAELQDDRDEHNRRAATDSGERISSQEETQNQLNETPSKAPES